MKLEKLFPALKYLNIPNAVTSAGLIFGVLAAYHLTRQDLRMSIIFLFFASVMDFADGLVASKLNQQTKFGGYLDTMVDFFTCCIMPIFMVFYLLDYNPLIIVALIFYSMCGLWRLAYYNVIEADNFTGLPVPGSMMLITISVWCVFTYGIPVWVAAVAFFIVGLLMLSKFQLAKYGLWQKVFAGLGLVFLLVVIFS